jgi:hypothetical protein
MSDFTPDEKVVKIMANFAGINPSMLIEPERLAVISNAKSVVANYKFPTPYTFEPFGLYDSSDALNIINALTKPEIEVKDKFINIIGANNDKVKYYTTATDLVPKVPDVEAKFAKVDCLLEFQLTADKLAVIQKMIGILKSKYLFLETEGKQIRLTIGDELESSGNNYDLVVVDGITTNNLDAPIKVALVDFKILPGEYNIKINKKITKWENLNGVIYYITTAA